MQTSSINNQTGGNSTKMISTQNIGNNNNNNNKETSGTSGIGISTGIMKNYKYAIKPTNALYTKYLKT